MFIVVTKESPIGDSFFIKLIHDLPIYFYMGIFKKKIEVKHEVKNNDTFSFDFASLYPTTMQTFGIKPESLEKIRLRKERLEKLEQLEKKSNDEISDS